MTTRNINLTGTLDEFVTDLIDSGAYQNASEVMRAGLRLLKAQQEQQTARVAALREAARIGEADFQAGRYETVYDIGAWLDRVESEVEKAQAKARHKSGK